MQIEQIQKKIYTLRGKEVILDVDLAALYEIDVKKIHAGVKKYSNRFPSDFIFQLKANECNSLRNQFGTLEQSQRKSSKEIHHAFTEHGVIMFSCSFRSKRIIETTNNVVRIFIQRREVELQRAKLIQDIANKYNKSVKEIHDIIICLLKTLKRSKASKRETISSLKRNHQNELIQKILLRRLR